MTSANPTFTRALYAAAVAIAIIAGAAMLFPRYTFLVAGTNAPVLYRCDRWTGNVTAAIRNHNTGQITWRVVGPQPDIFDRLPE